MNSSPKYQCLYTLKYMATLLIGALLSVCPLYFPPETVPGHRVSFSSYPGVLYSGDDFYQLSSRLVRHTKLCALYHSHCQLVLLNTRETGHTVDRESSYIIMYSHKASSSKCTRTGSVNLRLSSCYTLPHSR